MKKNILFLFFSIFLLSFMACKKENPAPPDDASYELSFSEEELSPLLNITAAGDTKTLKPIVKKTTKTNNGTKVDTLKGIAISEDLLTVKVKGEGIEANLKNGSITISIAPNLSDATREGELTVSPKGGTAVSVPIVQKESVKDPFASKDGNLPTDHAFVRLAHYNLKLDGTFLDRHNNEKDSADLLAEFILEEGHFNFATASTMSFPEGYRLPTLEEALEFMPAVGEKVVYRTDDTPPKLIYDYKKIGTVWFRYAIRILHKKSFLDLFEILAVDGQASEEAAKAKFDNWEEDEDVAVRFLARRGCAEKAEYVGNVKIGSEGYYWFVQQPENKSYCLFAFQDDVRMVDWIDPNWFCTVRPIKKLSTE